jgi:hypothetical protein
LPSPMVAMSIIDLASWFAYQGVWDSMRANKVGSGTPVAIMAAPRRLMKNPGETTIVKRPKPTRIPHTATKILACVRAVIGKSKN